MAPIVEYMNKKDFLIGSNVTFLDFYMLELCDFVQWLTDNEFLNENKKVARYVKKMKSLKFSQTFAESTHKIHSRLFLKRFMGLL